MREMKDSGIDIVGKIPINWNTVRLKYLCGIQTGNEDTQDAVDDGIYNFYVRSPIVEKSNRYTFDGEGILMAGDGVGAGRVFHHAFGKYAVHQRVYRLSDFNDIDPNYLYYYISNLFCMEMDKGSAQSTVPSVRLPMLLNFSICIPTKSEQKEISLFLDKKCTEIDSLISDIQKQIETLEQYKRSVITEAVTKGLDPDVEMRDSGVQWIGMIPKHWKVDNPKWHFVQRKDRATKGLTQLTASQKYGVVTQEEYMEITGAKVVTVEKDFDILKLVCPGDFIIHMRSFQGGLEYSEKYGSISSAYVMLIPQKTILEPRFYKWFFKSPVYIDALSSTSNLIRDGQAMRYANFIQLPIPLMPKEEQRQIADYLDSKCAEIDSIIAEKKQQIETIEEYKKSLIFEYVTGKKEVI